LDRRVVVQDYDPRWPQMFGMVRSRIAVVLNGVADSIEHIGSTAVPGLAAKPVIDIDVLLRSASDLPLVIRRLADLGYEHRGDLGVIGREAFRRSPRIFHTICMYAHQTAGNIVGISPFGIISGARRRCECIRFAEGQARHPILF
jgi:GrpB-like predicted nucleotidyltransferase (UPF0157 family)